jgi:hypothetical protein
MSPVEVAMHVKAWTERERRLDARAGIVACVIANRIATGDRPTQPADLFPSLEPPEPTPDELEAKLDSLRLTFGQ